MRLHTKPAALAVGLVTALAAVSLAQPPAARRGAAPRGSGSAASANEPLLVNGLIEWIEKSDVSAQTEGTIYDIELREGSEVARDGTIGSLHAEKAELTVAKARVAAEGKGGLAKAEAQRELAYTTLARLQRLNEKKLGYASKEEINKAEAEVKVGEAQIIDAHDNLKLAKAELDLAQQALKEHTITAPFAGTILKVLKHPGETVRANEAVVRIGKVDKLRFYGSLPIGNLGRVRPGMVVDVRPTIEDADVPIEQKRFRGKILFIGAEANNIGTTDVEVYADVINNQAKDLRPGLKAEMAIYLNDAAVPAPPADMLQPQDRVAKANR